MYSDSVCVSCSLTLIWYMTISPLRSLAGGASQVRDMLLESKDTTLTCVGAAEGAVRESDISYYRIGHYS